MDHRGSARGVRYRHATEADLEAEHSVFLAAEGALLARHGFGWTEPPPLDRVVPGRRHVLRHDADRCFVAEVDGVVVGYSAAIVRGDTWFLSSLFVDPAHQGLGIGRRLLELSSEGAPARRLTITDAIQPVSNALYGSFGLLPATPIIALEGRGGATPPRDLVATEPTAAALASLDAAVYGFDRAVDHAFWGREATATVWVRGGDAVAYSYRWPGRRLGPLAGRDAASAADALRAELARGEEERFVEIPGTSRSLLAVALGAGLRIVPPPGLLLTSEGVEPPRMLAIASYGLF